MRLLLWCALGLLLGCAQASPGGEADVDGGAPDGSPDGSREPSPERARLLRLIERYAPVLYLHPLERFRPSSVEWFLQRATLHRDGAVVAVGPAPEALPTTGSGYYLTLPEGARGGDLATALSYVHAKPAAVGGRHTDIQFWFFYPYNGPGTLLIETPITSNDFSLAPFGEHTGDWEHVTLRVDNGSDQLVALYLSQHSGGEWVMDPLRTMELEGGRPVIYASRNGHAAYRAAGRNLSEAGSSAGFTYGLRNDTAKGARLDCVVRFRIVADSEAPLTFAGRWGPLIDNAPFVDQVAQTIPIIGRQLAQTAIARERISNGPTSPAHKASWTQDE